MKKKMSRRLFLKSLLSFAAAGFTISIGGYSYARYMEPGLLDIQELVVADPKIPESFDGMKLIQFSDTHLSEYYTLGQLEHIQEIINDYSPDAVFFTGDLMDDPGSYKHPEKIIPLMKKIKAPLGKFAVYGNHDHGGYGSDAYSEIMSRAGFNVLKNETVKIRLANQSFITIGGLDDLILGRPDYERTAGAFHPDSYNILLAHEPDAWIRAKNFPVDLQLSGHSHGGQIQLPFYGPVITPPLADIYTEGLYKYGTRKLYVNRGLGTTRLPFRFLSMPELTVFTLKSSHV
ncbi:metallophosphoesterase [Bacillus sp. FJAT-42376]|uniref:metallophosphoesterase n=1 Tax=Bacillus sp. FJAT-42376 TaxID=2014076 RepID=UPI000F4DA4BE|nr:metallophosphoesterase [Bacillus sp. FJAT-42376]AZB42622.1 metallophosphoesterase [Bacillus sp. FJAT-42376]